MTRTALKIGLDVGSTTVKAVVVEARTGELLWQVCERHESRQLEMVLTFLKRIESMFPRVPAGQIQVSVTGSGGHALEELIGTQFYHPTEYGWETRIAERMREIRKIRERKNKP